MATLDRLTPATGAQVAEQLASCALDGTAVRIAGGGTRAGWGRPVEAAAELSTAALDEIVSHSAGDFTAVLGAGVPVATAQAAFAEAGQMLALDPPEADGATIGGLVATGDAGPRRHHYGPPRDLVIGLAVALPDGTVARAGGKVIKNVAGYDLSKLMAGAYGTLGVIVEVAVRLHPRPDSTATARFEAGDPAELRRIVDDLAHRPLECEALDVRWSRGTGAILARFAGATAAERAGALAGAEVVEDDDALWEAQRATQRSPDGVVLRVSALPSELTVVLAAADDAGAREVVGRAGVGTSYVTLPGGDVEAAAAAVERLRDAVAPATATILDAPAALRARLDPWGAPDDGQLALARRVKERFDPHRVCNPGLFLGGI